jgi:hypothetical protein
MEDPIVRIENLAKLLISLDPDALSEAPIGWLGRYFRTRLPMSRRTVVSSGVTSGPFIAPTFIRKRRPEPWGDKSSAPRSGSTPWTPSPGFRSMSPFKGKDVVGIYTNECYLEDFPEYPGVSDEGRKRCWDLQGEIITDRRRDAVKRELVKRGRVLRPKS